MRIKKYKFVEIVGTNISFTTRLCYWIDFSCADFNAGSHTCDHPSHN
jgi:hypothetical protein